MGAESSRGERHALNGAALGVLVLAATIGTVITLTPARHDFGKTIVPNGVSLEQFTVSGVNLGDVLHVSITGPQAGDFHILVVQLLRACGDNDTIYEAPCVIDVDFRPTTTGRKAATLLVTDNHGQRVTAALTGEGVTGVGCRMQVVYCNYAHLYSGTFIWTSTLAAPGSQDGEHVQVDVANGVATCNGSASSSEQGNTRTGAITGSGLIAIEFERDDAYRPVYRITVACPTPAWPAGENGEPATPSRPAELGHNEQKSYDQPASGPPGMTLRGSYSNPAPETDALNGVTGTVSVSWELCESAKYRVVVRPGTPPDSTGRTCS